MVTRRFVLGVLVLALGGACSTGGGGTTDGGTTSGSAEDGGSSSGGGGGGGGTGACPPTAVEALTEGCTMTLRSPADCVEVSFPAEFAWEADGCHTPYYLQIAGTPVAEGNYVSITARTEPANALAWAEPVQASALTGLQTSDGWYHWRVCNAYETGCSATRAFRVAP